MGQLPTATSTIISQYPKDKDQAPSTMEEEKKIDDADALASPSSCAVLPVNIQNLTFSYEANKEPNIVGLSCVIQPNSKVLLVGANGAGKSTLLRILTGQIFMGMSSDQFSINGKRQVNDQFNGVAYLGGTWKRRRTGFEGVCPYTSKCFCISSFKEILRLFGRPVTHAIDPTSSVG